MRKVSKLKVNAVVICVLKTHGLGHSELFMVIMKDTRLHISSHSPVIILLVMAVAGMLPLMELFALIGMQNVFASCIYSR